MSRKVTTAIFPVAGMGTRFLPATKAVPKEMLPLVDRPLIQYAVEEAKAAGIENFVFITNYGKSAIENHFDTAPVLEEAVRSKPELLSEVKASTMPPGAITAIRQQAALGLGHAVWCGRQIVGNEPFAVLLPDDVIAADKPCLAQMLEVYAEQDEDCSIVATMEVEHDQTRRYGVIDPAGDEDGRLVRARGMVEKPDPADAPSRLAVIGRYVLSPNVMTSLGEGRRGAGGEIQLTDAIAAETEAGRPVYGYRFDGQRYDCGDKLGFLEATVAFALARKDLGSSFARHLRDVAAGL